MKFHKQIRLIAVLFLFCLQLNSQTKSGWKTHWEESNYLETPRYKETIEYCQKLSEYSPMINYIIFGKSLQGRELPLLILDKDGLSDPVKIRAKNRIVVQIVAAIHPGEADGKDAMLALLRDIAINNTHTEFLNNVSIAFIPIFNVDGHERFTPYSRINQNGPKEGGWRTTARNLNLNRDFVKADAPEMQAWLKLYNYWNPEFLIDCHTTDGADYQYVVTYAVNGYSESNITKWINKEYVPEITDKMEELKQPIFPYVMFRNWHDPRSGLYGGLASPRYSNGYAAVRNRPGLLIETHMLKDYKTRVIATYNMVYETLKILSAKKDDLRKEIELAEKIVVTEKYRKKSCVLKYALSKTDSSMVTFKGIDYTVEKSDLTGGNWYKYNGIEKEFKLPYFNTLEPELEVQIPEAYVIPVEWKEVIERVLLHGVKSYTLTDTAILNFETYKFSDVEWRTTPYEGRFSIVNLDISAINRTKKFEKGAVVVPMNQANARLIAFMLEPMSEESFLRWGFFNAVFEQKEYVETYVMEKMAREMIKKSPELLKDFESWKLENPEMLDKPYSQLIWFYRKTPYFDREFNIYPVGRINSKEELQKILK